MRFDRNITGKNKIPHNKKIWKYRINIFHAENCFRKKILNINSENLFIIKIYHYTIYMNITLELIVF